MKRKTLVVAICALLLALHLFASDGTAAAVVLPVQDAVAPGSTYPHTPTLYAAAMSQTQLVMLANSDAAVAGWDEATFNYNSADYGEYPSLAVIPNTPLPRISFWDAANERIVAWLGGDVYKTLDLGSGVLPPSLGVDSWGRPHVAWSTDYGDVYYAVYDYTTGTFARHYVGDGAHFQVPVSLAIGPDDGVHIVYYRKADDSGGTRRSLVYAKWVGGLSYFDKFYVKELTVSYAFANGWGPSIAIDPAGYPHVAFYDYQTGQLAYMKASAAGWPASPDMVVDLGTLNIDHRTSIAVDSSGVPHISFWMRDTGGLAYCTYNSVSFAWACGLADADPRAGRYNDIAVDKNNMPHISYHMAVETNGLPDGDLKYITMSGGVWQSEILDTQGDTGIDTSIAVDSDGNTHIAFYDGNHRLRYIYETPPETGDLGNVGCAWGSRYCNPCASNVVDTFNSLRSHGDILSFYVDPYANPARDPDEVWSRFEDAYHHHWQGVARPMADGEPYLVTTLDRSEGRTDGGPWVPAAGVFSVAHLASRDNDGLRFGPNRLWEYISFWSGFKQLPPDDDKVVHSEAVSYDQTHPGGIQMVGDILAVPFTKADDDVVFYDLSDPANPR
ncbi:MAG: hypothetical protein MUQ10_15720, partial [Anaerolineae bacterium]|nr:hypothetical protein [Anaerolineae bacterium]